YHARSPRDVTTRDQMMESLAASGETREESAEPLLAACGLTVQAGETTVLRDVSFDLRRRRVLGGIGESGAGETKIRRLVPDQLPRGLAITAGTMPFEGKDLLQLSRREHRDLLGRRIAFIPQEPMAALNPAHTIGQHFDEHWGRLGVPKADRRNLAIEALAD